MEQTLIWCDFNAEQDELERLFGDKCFSIRGDTPAELKVEYNERWTAGERPVMITKPKCFGFGVNWQHCRKMIFCGLSDSFESYYQAVRRFYRFGQIHPVEILRILGDTELNILNTINRKANMKAHMQHSMAEAMKEFQTRKNSSFQLDLSEKTYEMPAWLKGA